MLHHFPPLLVFSALLFLSQPFLYSGEGIAIDFETAWERVICNYPKLDAAQLRIKIKEALCHQVSLIPNPIFILDADNIGVCSRDIGADPPEITYAISQLIELGGKRVARKQLASSEASAAFWEKQVILYDLQTLCHRAFILVAYSQEKLRLAQQREAGASYLLHAVTRQVDEGRISHIQLKQEQIRFKSAQMDCQKAERELIFAKNALASLWGAKWCDFSCVNYDFFCYQLPPNLCDAVVHLQQNPEFVFAKCEIAKCKKEYQLQKTYQIPDLTLSVGVKTYQASNQIGFVFGAQIPIPCFNLNQGNIRKASCELTEALCLFEDVVRNLEENIRIACDKLSADYDALELLRKGMLPDATEAFELTKRGYEHGKIEYRELLESQKLLFDIELQFLDLLYSYHLNQAQFDRYVGMYY